jgi:pyruvate/2-oxoacid:ferredoxin oxidoreductase alpha subunit
MDGLGVRLGRAWARDVIGAVALVESSIVHRVFVAVDWPDLPASNVFGESLACERGSDVPALARQCEQAAAAGERVALVASASDLAAARGELARIAAHRLGVVVHAIAEAGAPGTPPSLAGMAAALSLGDLPWGMLLGAGVGDAFDLALVARRAAEDSGCPFFVVHERSLAHHVEPIAAPSRELCDAFVGSPRAPVRRASFPPASSPSASSDRVFAERVPFALASAMREIEALTGRHHDVIERAPGGDTAVTLVGTGSLGESLIADVDRLRAGGHDVGAVRVVAWRPFPAARLVKAIGRAIAVAVLERVDQPLASNAPLAGQLKAAFADALTWAPDYPGIGRIPRIASGVLAPHREIDSTDLDAIVHNLLADERGKRTFVVGGDEAHALSTPPVTRAAGKTFAMRGIASRREVAAAAAELCVTVLASALGLLTRVAVRALSTEEGGGVAFDLVASRDRPRGEHAPHAVHVVALDDASPLACGNPLSRLAPGGLLAVPSQQLAADGLWAELPPWAKAIVFDRGARVLGWFPAPSDENVWVSAAAFVGIALAAATTDLATGGDRSDGTSPALPGRGRASIEGAVVAREVGDALRVAREGAADAAAIAERGGRIARQAFEGHVEVPRATIEREDDGVRLGRRDARVNSGL